MVDVVGPARAGVSYVEWGAVFAGALAATAISFVLLTAGASVGLSLTSPYPGASHGRLAASLAVFWEIAVPIGSLLVGGYIAGRMRSAWGVAAPEESQFRDSIHGLLVWALSIVGGSLLVFLAAGAVAQTSAQVSTSVFSDRGSVLAPTVDELLGGAVAPVAGNTAQGTAVNVESRAVVERTLTAAATQGALNPTQRQTIAQVVAARTGMSQADAEKRVDQAFARAQEAVEHARKAAVLAGLCTVTSLLVGLLAAWYAAQRGGHHRDNNVPARFTLSRRQLQTRS
jgi:hypothetical protein